MYTHLANQCKLIVRRWLKRLLTISLVVGLLLLTGCASNPVNRTALMDEYLQRAHELWNFEGAALISDGDSTLLSNGYGLANHAFGIPNTPSTKFFIGSITKQFTATAIMLLVEQGRVELDDPITEYLPDYPAETGDLITIRHLLTHTSGVPNYTDVPQVAIDRAQSISQKALLDIFKNKPLEFEPGSSFQYSNSGYIILGAIIEQVVGESYEAFLHHEVLNKLGMFNTGYARREAGLPERAHGYSIDSDGNLVDAVPVHLSVLHTAGALYSTVEDMKLWNRALANGDLLSRRSVRRMLRPSEFGYGFGWFIDSLYGHERAWHGGFLDGYNTTCDWWLDDDVCVVVFSNEDEAPVKKIARGLAAIAFDKPYDMPVVKQPISLDRKKLLPYEGVYRIGDDVHRLITLESDTLRDLLSGYLRQRLLPQAVDTFFFEHDNTRLLVFEKNRRGVVQGCLEINQGEYTYGERLRGEEAAELWISRDTIALGPEVLNKHLGVYKLESGIDNVDSPFLMHVTRVGSRMFVTVGLQGQAELKPSSETVFFHQDTDLTVTFIRDDNGNTVACDLKIGGMESHGVKVR